MEELFDIYVQGYECSQFSYSVMGKLLDEELVNNIVKKHELGDIYIYGGGYLGIQLYNALKDIINVKGIIDKNGKLAVKRDGIVVYSIDELKEIYSGERVIITPIKYYVDIKRDLSEIVKLDKVMFIGELFGEVMR